MIGVERVPISLFFQTTFLPLGSPLSIRPVSREMPFCSGPRQLGQSTGSAWATSCRAKTTRLVQTARPTYRSRCVMVMDLWAKEPIGGASGRGSFSAAVRRSSPSTSGRFTHPGALDEPKAYKAAPSSQGRMVQECRPSRQTRRHSQIGYESGLREGSAFGQFISPNLQTEGVSQTIRRGGQTSEDRRSTPASLRSPDAGRPGES